MFVLTNGYHQPLRSAAGAYITGPTRILAAHDSLLMTAPSLPTLPQLRQEIDRIDSAMHELLMERGRIIETGTHRQLLAAGGAYARLYQAQFAEAGAATAV